MDLSLGGLLRLYLYLASLAGVIAFAIGLAGIISYILAAAFGLDVIYGGPRPNIQPAFPIQICPPGTTCPPFPSPITPQIPPAPGDPVPQQAETPLRGG